MSLYNTLYHCLSFKIDTILVTIFYFVLPVIKRFGVFQICNRYDKILSLEKPAIYCKYRQQDSFEISLRFPNYWNREDSCEIHLVSALYLFFGYHRATQDIFAWSKFCSIAAISDFEVMICRNRYHLRQVCVGVLNFYLK